MSPTLVDGQLEWIDVIGTANPNVIACSSEEFQSTGGTKVLHGNLGSAVIKVSAVAKEYRFIEAPAKVFISQHDVEIAYKKGLLNQDCIIVVIHNGPAANGMPELHKLMPILGNIQKDGYKVALVTDGRLSGASGKIPAAIHISPEALRGGVIGLIQEGDIVRLDSENGKLDLLTSYEGRQPMFLDTEKDQITWGRDMFKIMRDNVSSAEEGASFLY
jgi:phosphogluconate dehydratase